MKLQSVRVKIIEEADAATLEASVNAFLASDTVREFIPPIQYQVAIARTSAAVISSADAITEKLPNTTDDTKVDSYSAMITYTE